MFLEDKSADLKIETGSSREIWWITGDNEITIMTDCPGNYPRTSIFTLPFDDAIEACKDQVASGWGVVFNSPEFRKLMGWED